MSESACRVPLSPSRFLTTTGLTIFALAIAGAAFNWWVNFYGLYGDVHGQQRTVATNERWSKYLYTFNQLPSNYDALLVGSSLSSNLDTASVRAFKMYNLSMTGANVAEEQVLLDSALRHGRYRLIVFCLYPYMLKDHTLKGSHVAPRDYWAGLGSLPLLEDYLVTAAVNLRVFAPRFRASGAQDLQTSGTPPMDADAALQLMLKQTSGHPTIDIDPVALAQLAALVSRARASGATLAVYFPPVYRPRYESMHAAYLTFGRKMLTMFGPNEAVIDLNDGTFAEFATASSNFWDGSHYSRKGAAFLDHAFADRLEAALSGIARKNVSR